MNDILGGDYTINQCAFMCVSIAACKGFTYLPNAGGPKCWLKDAICTSKMVTMSSMSIDKQSEIIEDEINPTPPKPSVKVRCIVFTKTGGSFLHCMSLNL